MYSGPNKHLISLLALYFDENDKLTFLFIFGERENNIILKA